MIKKTVSLFLFLIVLSTPSSMAIASYFDNPTPYCGETDVEITLKGVQTCVDVYVPSGCYVNLTFYWLNWSYGWQTYASFTFQNTTGQFCVWNDNVTCYIDGDFRTTFIWLVVAEFYCPQQNYSFNDAFLCNFRAEPCPLFYIYPEHNSTVVCPCCDAMCLGINNENGHDMNLTFYRNDTMNETFYLVNKYFDVGNGTYCFCLDGHMADMYYPMRYNETYHWYVNVTDTTTGDYEVSDIFNFTTAQYISDCPCGEDATGNKFIFIKKDMVYFFLLLAMIILGLIAFKKRNKIIYK